MQANGTWRRFVIRKYAVQNMLVNLLLARKRLDAFTASERLWIFSSITIVNA